MNEPVWTDGIPADRLRCMLVNIGNVASRQWRNITWVGLVSQSFGIGSTHARALCRRAAIMPDALVRNPLAVTPE